MKKRRFIMLAAMLTIATITGSLAGCASAKSSATAYPETMAVVEEYGHISEFDTAAKTGADSGGSGAINPAANAGKTLPAASNRKLIRNVDLSVETTAFDTLITSISSSADEFGGYMERSSVNGNSISSSNSRRYADMVIRMPADKLDAFLEKVAEQGNIVYQSENVQDVTLQYSDIESRKKSLSIEQDRIWALLEKADTLEAVIALESRLSEIRYELESFESQLRLYDNQVTYSTLSINISEVTVFTPTAPDSVATRIQKGFSRNLANVSNGLVNLFVWSVSSLPVLLPLAVIAGAALIMIKRKGKKTGVKEDE